MLGIDDIDKENDKDVDNVNRDEGQWMKISQHSSFFIRTPLILVV
jgi:hypothetical protein